MLVHKLCKFFDSWGGALAHREYIEFSLNSMRRIVNGLQREKDGRKVPVILFTKGGGQWLEPMISYGCRCFWYQIGQPTCTLHVKQ